MKERMNIHKSMKHIVLLLTGTFMFASCADDEIISNDNLLTGKGISFNIANDKEAWKPDTRSAQAKSDATLHCEAPDGGFSIDATVVDGIRSFQTEQPQSRGTQTTAPGSNWSYKVGAYYYQTADAAPIDFFTENATGGLTFGSEGTGTSTYYWPKNGKISFFAVAPANIQGFNVPTAENIDAPSFTYTIDSDVTKHQDIMVARTTPMNTPTAAVGLQFKHLLAAVQFKVGTMQFIKINKLTISGIKGGSVTMTYNNDMWTYSGGETTSYSPIYYTDETTKEPNIDTSGLPSGSDITGNENGLTMLMMPQEPGANAKITVSYTNIITGDYFENKSASIAAVVDENGVKKGVWEAGKTTVYTLNIDSNIAVEIQSPSDADAHYVRVDMQYDLSGFSGLNGIQISDIKAQAYWLNDNSNTASDDKQAIYLKTTLTDMQSKGYFTDELWEVRYTVNEDTKEVTYTVGSKDGPALVNTNILGTTTVDLTNGSSGNIYLFLDENDGNTDRNGELIINAKVTRNGTKYDVVLAKGRFKQLCPSRNTEGLGVERFERGESYSYGFNYNRVVTYTNKYLNMSKFWQAIYRILLFLFGMSVDTILPNVDGQAEGFVTTTTGTDVFGDEMIKEIKLNYVALNAVKNISKDKDGLNNTTALYNYTGATDISELENELDKSLELDKNGNSDLWRKIIKPEGTPNPEYYAAYIALTCNRMREFVQYENGVVKLRKAILHKEGEGGTDNKGDESGDNIIEWYLPSSVEAQTLVETGTGEESTPISPLDGTYWSSTAGDDTNAYAHSYTFSKNTYDKIKEDQPRMNELKVRAVRKKPTTGK